VAQKVQTLLADDVDGSAAEGTACSGPDGTQHENDLNAAHAQQQRDALASPREGWAAGSRRLPPAWPRRAPRIGERAEHQ
jgi:Lsr2